MRRSPRRPLILKRRKLPFQLNEPASADAHAQPAGSKEPPKPAASQCFPDGVRIMDHPSMSGTQVVVIPKTADLQSVIGALTAKGKECGVQGPNKFILLSQSQNNGSFCHASVKEESVPPSSAAGQPAESVLGSPDAKPVSGIKSMNKEANGRPLDDSLTNIQWLGRMSSCALEQEAVKQDQENQSSTTQENQSSPSQDECAADCGQQSMAERPPYSYMAMIQFAINSSNSRKMTLKEIYTWIEDHFPYYREVAKPGWKNSIRHNLSLHDMFIRETSPDGKTSFWTIRPEVNRCLTFDQVYKMMTPTMRKTPTCTERKIKPLLPRTESFLVPIQLPVASSVYLPSFSTSFGSAGTKRKHNFSRTAKKVRIAPKVTQSDSTAVVRSPLRNNSLNVEIKEEPVDVSVKCETPKAPPKVQASRSRRKQRLNSLHEEPILLCPDNTFFDSGVAFDASTFQDQDAEFNQHQGQDSPDQEFSFKTPIKSSRLMTFSTPSKSPPNVVTEPWKVTPVGNQSQSVLDFSPIRTPGGPAVTPQNDYTTFSFSSTPFKEFSLFSSPRELLSTAPARVPRPKETPVEIMRSSCSRGLLQTGAASPPNRSITEGLVLDTMNDSLSKILVDISFTGLDGEDLGTANLSWSEFIGHF
ncbi:forkhead box protein M1 [Nematolebias whitei]|uniref:forkhead box protein M1 n=1 Tax=Nematolebias whitei TaxID=451745 RepID=UPI001899C8B2|nr:forkhead box protein M1 [Nematolebias whitei]